MSIRTIIKGLLILMMAGSAACSREDPATRWFTPEQVSRGKVHYMQHCADCHKADASGTRDWRTPTADGHYPPPPLNDDAHAWHHSNMVLLETIQKGGIAFGGVMPPFEDKLSKSQMMDVIAYFQNTWSDEIYAIWKQRDQH